MLTPTATESLVKAIKSAVDLPIQLHTHYTSGLASMCLLKGVEAGADGIDTAISPLALGTSHAPTESMVAAFAGTPYDTGLDIKQLAEIRAYFMTLREKYFKNGLLDQKMLATDAKALIYQVPGGMLSNLLIYFVVPFMIINSYMSGYNAEILKNMGRMLFYSILTICIGMALSIGITFLMKKEVRGIIRFATTFSNAAYMGFPLIQAMYGSEGVLYASVYVTVFNILLWTVGIVYVSESMSFKELLKKIVTCPPIISVAVGLVIFLARIPVADVLKDTFNVVGGMNTPLSMIITGITISQFPLLSILKDKRVYFTVILRMFIIPVICTLVMYLIHARGMVAVITIILEACPCAAITTLFAIKFGHDQKLAVGAVTLSTLISIITLPCLALLAGEIIM